MIAETDNGGAQIGPIVTIAAMVAPRRVAITAVPCFRALVLATGCMRLRLRLRGARCTRPIRRPRLARLALHRLGLAALGLRTR